MSNIIFKRLFEVQIFHDYFLTTDEGTSFFGMSRNDKNELIAKKLTRGIYNINDFFEIEPLSDTKTRISEYKLIMKTTALGLLVGVEVNVENKLGEIVYKPRFEMSENINLTFSIKPKIPFFKSITNINLRSKLPSIYYFTNKNKEEFNDVDHKSLPISNKVDLHQDGKVYEMGTLVDFGGTIKEALQYTDGSNLDHWKNIDERRFVNNADKILLPNKFNYTVSKEQNITQAEFILKDESDNELIKINKNSIETLENVYLDFSENEASVDIASGFYTLTIKENGGPEVIYNVYLNNEMYDKNYFGIIDIRFDELNSPYSLLADTDFLKTKIDVANQKISHPIFEIRFKNRNTYWRYNKEIDFTIDEKNGSNDFLNSVSDVALVSAHPKGLTEVLIPFKSSPPDPPLELMLPPPKVSSIKIENKKIFSEIYINQSNRLLES